VSLLNKRDSQTVNRVAWSTVRVGLIFEATPNPSLQKMPFDVPWQNWSEWERVREMLYAEEARLQWEGIKRVCYFAFLSHY
jgi:hypothetical protein